MKVLFLSVLLALVPVAVAVEADPLHDPACETIPAAPCVGPGSCVEYGCVPTSCEPALRCASSLNDPEECAENLTIDGRMCQTRIALGIEHRGIDGPAGVGVPGSEVWIAAAVSDGRVNDLNLVNKWITPSVETDATLAGIGVGRTYAGVYQSEILTEGERGGAYGLLFPASNQTWMHVALVVGTDAGPGEQLQVAVWFLDLMPNGCHLRSASERTDVDCPRVHEFLP